MYIHLDDDERISLTIKEIAVLLELKDGPSNGYQLAKACQLGQSTVYPAVKRLELGGLISPIKTTDPSLRPGKPRKIYQITPVGELILSQHIIVLEQLVRTAKS